MAIVEVKPIERTKWHGKKGKESFSQPKAVEALVDVETGRYATGLTSEEAIEYGKRLNVDLSDAWKPEESHPFYGTKTGTVYLQNSTMLFDTNKPLDYVKVKLMKASKFVASSPEEILQKADATHMIFDEEDEIKVKAAKLVLKKKAMDYAFKMGLEDKLSVVQVLSKKTMRGASQDKIEVEFDEIINNNPDQFLEFVSMGRENVAITAMIEEAVYRNILTRDAAGIYYMGEMLAPDTESSVKFLRDPKNERLKALLYEKLNK